jgi:hypothetical protein
MRLTQGLDPILDGLFQERPGNGHPGIVDQNINPAKFFNEGLGKADHLVLFGDIAHENLQGIALRAGRFHAFLGMGFV